MTKNQLIRFAILDHLLKRVERRVFGGGENKRIGQEYAERVELLGRQFRNADFVTDNRNANYKRTYTGFPGYSATAPPALMNVMAAAVAITSFSRSPPVNCIII